MWEQDDWNSCEDLTLCHTILSACDHNLDGQTETGKKKPCRDSSYPVGCTPDKILKEDETSDQMKSEIKDHSRRPLFDCIKHTKRIWMKAITRFLGAGNQTRPREAASKRNSLKKLRRPGDHRTSKSTFPNQHPCPGFKVPLGGRASQASQSAKPVQLWSLTQSIRKRFSRSVSSSYLKRPRHKPEEQSRKTSSLEALSMSTRSSVSLPLNRPEDSGDETLKGTQDLTSPYSLPRLDAFEPFSFEPTNLIEELS
ncbi:hypothetical protein PGTUg99_015659 [Puccinia graminis f. sp. tritici]|uniref:Uncharacterized protein n=1 Tax=Puccinia graminis f. sp. tritici TaxID=56615 RepID=A0A5B0RKT3_PUCGR|nr:hypothetical protein PGTUg99_015659 [Puccinia graminis f. sp. tritici]